MANDTTQSPWILDTAATIDSSSNEVRIKRLKWVGGTTAGHTCVIQNGAGTRNVWEDVAPAANYVASEEFGDKGLLTYGFKLTTIASGKLYVYFMGT